MANNRMSGNLLGLEINGKYISCETSCEFTFDSELLPASPLEEGGWAEWIVGIRNWGIVLNAGMMLRMMGTGLPEVLNAFVKGEKINIRFSVVKADVPNFIISGKVFANSGGINASVNSRATWNVTLKGDGPFVAEINTNTAFALGTGITNEVVEDGKGHYVGGRGGIKIPETI